MSVQSHPSGSIHPSKVHGSDISEHCKVLHSHITSVKDKLVQCGNNNNTVLKELFVIVHGPGWTTLAESMLTSAVLDSLHAQADEVNQISADLLHSAQAVGVQEDRNEDYASRNRSSNKYQTDNDNNQGDHVAMIQSKITSLTEKLNHMSGVQLSSRPSDVSTGGTGSAAQGLQALLQIIIKSGFTSPAEMRFTFAALNAISDRTDHINRMSRQLTKAAKAVGQH